MSRVIRVRYEKGVLKPLEPLDLREGEEIVVEVKVSRRGLRRFYGVLKDVKHRVSEEDYYEYVSERSSIS